MRLNYKVIKGLDFLLLPQCTIYMRHTLETLTDYADYLGTCPFAVIQQAIRCVWKSPVPGIWWAVWKAFRKATLEMVRLQHLDVMGLVWLRMPPTVHPTGIRVTLRVVKPGVEILDLQTGQTGDACWPAPVSPAVLGASNRWWYLLLMNEKYCNKEWHVFDILTEEFSGLQDHTSVYRWEQRIEMERTSLPFFCMFL